MPSTGPVEQANAVRATPGSRRSASAAKLRNVLSGLIANGSLATSLSRLDLQDLVRLDRDWPVWAREDQLPPPLEASGHAWRVWLILGGRGAGKTRAGAEWVRAKALGRAGQKDRPAQRIALIGETMSEARRVMVECVSGILAVHAEDECPEFKASKMQLVWPQPCNPAAWPPVRAAQGLAVNRS